MPDLTLFWQYIEKQNISQNAKSGPIQPIGQDFIFFILLFSYVFVALGLFCNFTIALSTILLSYKICYQPKDNLSKELKVKQSKPTSTYEINSNINIKCQQNIIAY